MSDDELTRAAAELHVFGRVSPEDKLRLASGDAGAGPDRRDDRRRRERRRRAEAGRHRRRDGIRQRGHQAGRPHDPHRRQLRHARARRRDRPPRVRQGRLVRPLPDDAAAGAGDAVRRRDRVQHQRGCRPDAAHGLVPAVLRDVVRGRHHRDRPRRSRRDAPPAARSEGPDHQPHAVLWWIVYGAAVFFARASSRSSAGPDKPSTDAADRVADDDVRGDGARHGVQRADEPPRPGQRARAADPQGARQSRSFR